MIAYADRFDPVPGIRVRWLARDETELLPGTGDVAYLAFAPDGRSLVYGVVANPYVVRTISVDGRTSNNPNPFAQDERHLTRTCIGTSRQVERLPNAWLLLRAIQ